MQVSVRAAMQRLVKLPAWVYQRQQAFWDRVVLACGWMWLYLLCSGIEPWLRLSTQEGSGASATLLPAQWRAVMAALVLVLGLWRPVAGYAAFIVAVAYPLYLISVYVMALALAVLVLLAPVMALYAEQGVLYLAVLVLMTVVLAPLHLAPLVPLLAGLWWQGAGSWVGGGVAALWLKLCAAMSGHSVDLWSLYGWTMKSGPVYQRFHTANSLQTVAYMVQPFGIHLEPLVRATGVGREWPGPVSPGLYLLFNLLQVCAWAAAAFVVSAVMEHLSVRWAGRGRAGGQAVLSLLPGLALIWIGFVALPSWLGVEGPRWLEPPWLVAQVVWLGVVAWGVDAFLRYLRRPVSLETSVEAGILRSATSKQPLSTRSSETDGSPAAAVRRVRRSLRHMGRGGGKQEQDSDQESSQTSDIMIELD
jgi:hypothetical protein